MLTAIYFNATIISILRQQLFFFFCFLKIETFSSNKTHIVIYFFLFNRKLINQRDCQKL